MAFTRSVPPALNPAQQRAAASDLHSVDGSIIGGDLSIEGAAITIRCKGTLRVNGNVQADLHCVELLIGEQAVIVGTITANRVAVSGRVNGAILGDSVVLHSTAHVDGDISSRTLSIAEGAIFDGRSRKFTDASEVVPQVEAPVT